MSQTWRTSFSTLVRILLAADLASIGIESARTWEKHWRRFSFTTAQQAEANKLLPKALLAAWADRSAAIAQTSAAIPDLYDPIDFSSSKLGSRLAPLCRLYIAKLDASGKVPKFVYPKIKCSCSFVRPQVVMTAGHCFFPKKTKADGSFNGIIEVGSDPNILVFAVRQYAKDSKDEAGFLSYLSANTHLATEWWTPNNYRGNVDSSGNTDRKALKKDIAFIKVSTAVPPDSHYTLTVPDFGQGREDCGFLRPATHALVLGYPTDASSSEVPVGVAGFAKPYSKDKDAFMTKYQIQFEASGLKFGKGDSKLGVKLVKGDMAPGGSGGPWILGKDIGCEMNVYGLTSVGSSQRSSSFSPIFTKELILALDAIEKLPTVITKTTTPASAIVLDNEGDNVQFIDLKNLAENA